MKVIGSYPLPCMDECMETFSELRTLDTMDGFNGYWEINIAKKDQPKTFFVCYYGHIQYMNMTTNAAGTLRSAVDIITSRCKCRQCPVYIYDIIIFQKTIDDYIKHVNEILPTLEQNVVT